jgi:uroporphyrinogen decarboxylase
MPQSPPAPTTHAISCRFLAPFTGNPVSPPPVWLMRQAGRHLPEYRALRQRAGSFLDLCYTPALAAEATLQPIRRYGFDAAILFSDILVVPNALGQQVAFTNSEGPRLEPVRCVADLARLDPGRTRSVFERVWEAAGRVRQALPADTALIGFCGAPWTVATYMVAGQSSADQGEARLWAYRDPEGFARLIDLVTEVSIAYLAGQVAAGANVLQIFDTWAGVLPDREFQRWVIAPTARIMAALARDNPQVAVIGFPPGAYAAAARYAAETAVHGLGCDSTVPLAAMRDVLSRPDLVIQGNLDPVLLVAGGLALERRVAEILAAMANKPFVFNLGHGIRPETPPEHVARLVELVRGS